MKISFLVGIFAFGIVFFTEANAESRLRMASLECRVADFSAHMDKPTQKLVSEFTKNSTQVKAVMASVFQKSVAKFGQGVLRRQQGIRIPIEGKDYRWNQIFGKQWAIAKNKIPNGPFYFDINAFMDWDKECTILSRYEACLDNPKYCSESKIEGAVLKIRKTGNEWQIVKSISNEELAAGQKMQSAAIDMAKWVDAYLDNIADIPNSEELKIRFAFDFSAAVAKIMAELR